MKAELGLEAGSSNCNISESTALTHECLDSVVVSTLKESNKNQNSGKVSSAVGHTIELDLNCKVELENDNGTLIPSNSGLKDQVVQCSSPAESETNPSRCTVPFIQSISVHSVQVDDDYNSTQNCSTDPSSNSTTSPPQIVPVLETLLQDKSSSPLEEAKPKGLHAPPSPRLCDICHLSAPKYNFKCCSWRCCSLKCYKVHTRRQFENVTPETSESGSNGIATTLSSDSPFGQSLQNESRDISQIDKETEKQEKASSTISEALQAACGGPRHLTADEVFAAREKRKAERMGRNAEEDDDEEEENLLSEEQKKRLATNPKLQEWYSSLSLRKAVRAIDGAPRRLDKLAQYMLHEEFNEFVNDMLDTLEDKHTDDAFVGLS